MSKQRFGTGMGSGNGPAIQRGVFIGGGCARAGITLGSGHRLAGGMGGSGNGPVLRGLGFGSGN
jgi:hypothetical protein